MTGTDLMKFLGALGILGGGARIVASFIPEMSDEAIREGFYLAIDLGLLFGLTGFIFAVSSGTGRLGLIGYLIAASGIALIAGPDGQFMEWDIYETGSLVIGAGLLILSVALFINRTHVLPGLFWTLALATALAAPYVGNMPAIEMILGTFFGLGFVVAGLVAVTQK